LTIKARDTSRITAAEMKYMRKTAVYIWTDYKTCIGTPKELNITPVLEKYNTKEIGCNG
jgi:Tfp pilus assembly protein PilZ